MTRRYEFDGSLVFMPLEMLQEDLEYGNQAVNSIDPRHRRSGGGAARGRRAAQALGTRRSQGRRLARPQCPLRGRVAGRAGDDVHHPHPDRRGGGHERGGELHHAGRVKRGSIAILRTMGASPRTIVRAFFLSAAAVGLVGTGRRHGARPAGLRQHAVDRRHCCQRSPARPAAVRPRSISSTSMPVRVDAVEVASIVVVAIVLSLAAAAYPAWRSTKVEPVEGLRHE